VFDRGFPFAFFAFSGLLHKPLLFITGTFRFHNTFFAGKWDKICSWDVENYSLFVRFGLQ